MKKTYIHYGDKLFDNKKFIEIKNDNWVKPYGGLWASDINAKFGWKDWCKQENFRECNINNSFTFKIKDNAKILVIDSKEKLLELPKEDTRYEYSWVNLDFEKIKKEYDAIEVLISSDHRLYWDLYGWDCDSILIMNPECIEVISNE